MRKGETIFALASAPGRGGVAVLRISGPDALKALKELSPLSQTPKSRRAVMRHLVDNVSRETLDHALILYFNAPHSYTGEDVVELHLHGGRAVIEGVTSALSRIKNMRLAEPGEFTRRAFENNKMDLTEAEAVADLIHAETEAQKIQALSQMDGALRDLYSSWRADLVSALAYVEADLDFIDEEDVPDGIADAVRPKVEKIAADITAHLSDNRRGERLRDGVSVVIIGAPNAGKSTLVNALAQRDVAIVSEMAGTTRDIIDVPLDLGGYPVIISDTAGLRPDELTAAGQDAIEAEGIRRALEKARNADIQVLLFSAADLPEIDTGTRRLIGENTMLVFSKCEKNDSIPAEIDNVQALQLSVETGRGMEIFLETLVKQVEQMLGRTDVPALTRERHRASLEEASLSLSRSLEAQSAELAAEDIRLAVRAIGRITGRVDVEDLLDVIFSDFCIGK